jgi:hypothetical protein
MADKYDLAYLNVKELPQYTGGDTSSDKELVFDTSAGRWETRNVGGANVAAGATLTLTAEAHAGRIINLDTAAGSTVTLPAATGSGNLYRFRVSVLATSNSHVIKVANVSDTMEGVAIIADTDTAGVGYQFMAAPATSDTITLNRSTTGSVTLGEYIEVEDVATNRFAVLAYLSGTGTPLTPFSATV